MRPYGRGPTDEETTRRTVACSKPAAPRNALEHRVDQARLADPRLRDQAHDLRPAIRRRAVAAESTCAELGVAADERRLEPLRGEAAQIGRPRIVNTEQPIHLQRLGLAFQRQHAGGLERELALGQLVGGGAHQRLPRAAPPTAGAPPCSPHRRSPRTLRPPPCRDGPRRPGRC